MNNFKPLLGIAFAIAFICIGYYLTQKESTFAINVGYVSIVFWSAILLFAIYKKITTTKTNNKI